MFSSQKILKISLICFLIDFTCFITFHNIRVKDWSFVDTIPNTPVNIGTYYSTVWKSLQQVIDEAVASYTQNRTNTFKFRDTMFNTSLPWQVVDSAAGRISVLK